MPDPTLQGAKVLHELGHALRPEPIHTDGTPVVLVHGILGQEILYWNIVKRWLRGHGVVAHEISLPTLALGDLREAAVTFRDKLIKLQHHLDLSEFDVVAHSAGGLVVRYFIQSLQSNEPIRRLITLGTPHQGTTTAKVLPELGMMRQVRPDSEFLTELNASPPKGPTKYTAVWNPLDGIIIPGVNAKLPDRPNTENILLRGVTHWGYLVQPRVAQFIAHTLERGFVGGDREWAPEKRVRKV